MVDLNVLMNGYHVGIFSKNPQGTHSFTYSKKWLTNQNSRPISLSMPLRQSPYIGDEVYNYFDNLLPDNSQVRDRIVTRHHANSTQPFDLLSAIGQDSIGALQLIPANYQAPDIKKITKKSLTDSALVKIIKGYQSNIPLGMLKENDDFRISIAGAQEKTALLNLNDQWYLPTGSTPTTHILKLPIGTIVSHSHTLDMTDSVENELVCMQLSHAFGLPTAHCNILNVGDVKVLSVQRFDRKKSSDNQWIMRLPQEDFCQILNKPSGLKYQSDGGPDIKDIMNVLLGSDQPQRDRATFMMSQVLFWLLAASDGHAKNFSIFINPKGGYQLTPLYDIMSVYPVMGSKGLNKREIKMAMKLNSPTTAKGTYLWERIFPRHFIATAKACGFSQEAMQDILQNFKQQAPLAIATVRANLPKNFPTKISETIFDGVLERAKRL
ncbi:MAG: type II toxin-antitoxin system HipA family toxin [Gammaproteobacteria bacterium]|nr:type II toxin-antitoxin system HipA family toxin [Gammaproteobacteria bacterium]